MRFGDEESLFQYFCLKNNDPLPELGGLGPYKCLVLVSDDVTNTWRNEVCDWLVATGCLYMMAWGIDCSIWDDCVDEANLETFDFEDIPDDKFVMTTWHEKDSLEDVIFFAKYQGNHPDVELKSLVILDIGKVGRQAELENLYGAA